MCGNEGGRLKAEDLHSLGEQNVAYRFQNQALLVVFNKAPLELDETWEVT